MADIRWYAMPVGFFSQLAVCRVKTQYKSEGVGVLVQVLEFIAMSPGCRVRGALIGTAGSGWELDPVFLSSLASTTQSPESLISDVIHLLLVEGIFDCEEGELSCGFISASLDEQGSRKDYEKEKKRRQRESRNVPDLVPGTVPGTVLGTPRGQKNLSLSCPPYIHTDRPTDRQTDRNGSAAPGNLGQTSAALLSKIQTNGRC